MNTIDSFEVSRIKPLRKDVLVKHVPSQQTKTSVIVVKENNDAKIQAFEVLRIGEEVTEVSVGDTILVPWGKVTSPFPANTSDGVIKVGVTNEKEIYAVLEQ